MFQNRLAVTWSAGPVTCQRNWIFVSLDEFYSHLLHKSKYKPNQITDSGFYVMEGSKFLPEVFLLVGVVQVFPHETVFCGMKHTLTALHSKHLQTSSF